MTPAPPIPDRCPEALEAPLPDTEGHRRESLILQCDKSVHHKGVHRLIAELTWST